MFNYDKFFGLNIVLRMPYEIECNRKKISMNSSIESSVYDEILSGMETTRVLTIYSVVFSSMHRLRFLRHKLYFT